MNHCGSTYLLGAMNEEYERPVVYSVQRESVRADVSVKMAVYCSKNVFETGVIDVTRGSCQLEMKSKSLKKKNIWVCGFRKKC